MDDSGILLRKMDITLLCGLDQVEDQAISIDQLVLIGKPSPSCTEGGIGSAEVPGEVGGVVLVTLLILQRSGVPRI